MTNFYPGLARGPIDHQSSSVINAISFDAIEMGSVVRLAAPLEPTELLPTVQEIPGGMPGQAAYGIVVGGDADGVYGDGNVLPNDLSRAAFGSNFGVAVCTQGRCLAKVDQEVLIGNQLTPGFTAAQIQKAAVGQFVIAIALQDADVPASDMIAVDVQRAGKFS